LWNLARVNTTAGFAVQQVLPPDQILGWWCNLVKYGLYCADLICVPYAEMGLKNYFETACSIHPV